MFRATPVLAAALAAAALAGCGAPASQSTSASASGSTGAASCAKASLPLVAGPKLTIGTDKPAYAPWFVDDDPANGKGYESAVAYAVAERLGFAKDDVAWTSVTFNQAISPGRKTFDLDLNQISISPERAKALDFSTGYYDVRQAVVALKGGAAAGVTTTAGLAGLHLGAQVGSTSLKAVTDQVRPSRQAAVFDSNDLAVQALKAKQVDAIVVDLPTAFYMTAAQLDGAGVIVGQLPASGTPEQFGAVLAKGSALTPCVSKAVDALRADGTLARLQKQWLTESGAPELK